MTLSPDQLAQLIAAYAGDAKAIDPIELDLRDVLGYTDYFVICTGNTDRQTKAIHDRIHEGMKKEHGMLPRRVEGLAEARWILMDYLDVVVHVFTPEARGGPRPAPATRPARLLVAPRDNRAGRSPHSPRVTMRHMSRRLLVAIGLAGFACGIAIAAVTLASGHV